MLTQEVAAAIRVIRTKRGAAYEDLANVGVQRSISALEQAHVNISVSKLAELAVALDFDLVALVALCVSLQRAESPQVTLHRAMAAMEEFTSSGGEKLLEDQYSAGQLIKRPRGKPANRENASAVRALKARGCSQAEIVKNLGLSKSTVHRYWREKMADEPGSA